LGESPKRSLHLLCGAKHGLADGAALGDAHRAHDGSGAGAADEEMKYHWQIYSLGDMSRLELLHPTGPGSFLDGFLKEREGGVHHITLQTNLALFLT
jgi:hypothetical protein